jgi:hypothetical protein
VSDRPRKIHILGCAGSGKTTLAKALSTRLDAPYYELDVVGYENGNGAKRPLEDRQADLRRVVAQPAWITEGSFLWWVDALLESADLLIWLDLDWKLCYWRIVLRHVKADLARNNRHPGFRNMLAFAKGVRPSFLQRDPYAPSGPNDDGSNRAATERILARYGDKTARCRNPRAVRRLLRSLAETP